MSTERPRARARTLRGGLRRLALGVATLALGVATLAGALHLGRGPALGLGLLALGAAVLLADRVATRLQGKLSALAHSAREVAGGNLRHRPVIPGAEEVDPLLPAHLDLLEAFERRDTRHRLAQDHLEALVKDRTADLKATRAELERHLIHDSLTGLPNRRFAELVIPAFAEQALRAYGDHLAKGVALPPQPDLIFFMVDVDHFRTVNERFGNAAGDALIQQFARRLQGTVREMDLLVHFEGQAFLVLARAMRREQGAMVARRLVAAARAEAFDLGTPFPRTCSVGFAPFPLDPAHPYGTPWHQVVMLASRCLHGAKTTGRDNFVGLLRGPGDAEAQEAFLRQGPAGPGWQLDHGFDEALYWAPANPPQGSSEAPRRKVSPSAP